MTLTKEARNAYLVGWRERKREHLREYHCVWRRSKGIGPLPPMRHGTRYGYKTGCKCEPCVAAEKTYQEKWKAANPEKERAKFARYRERHPEAIRAGQKRYRESDHGRAKRRERQAKDPDAWKRWYWADPERNRMLKRAMSARRRARQLDAEGRATADQIRARIEFWGWKCWVCGGPFEHVDHVKPLAAGGSNWPANLRPICASCNISKRDKYPYYPQGEVSRGHLTLLRSA